MNSTLKRAGVLNKNGIEYVTDIYTGRKIPTQTKLEDGKNSPKAAQREHVKSSSECYQRPSLQMSNTSQELADIINNPENLQGYTTAERNNRKSDASASEMEDRDKNKHWEKCNKKAEDFISGKEQEGEKRLKEDGRKSQREEGLRMGKKVLQGIVMGLLAMLLKTIFQKFVVWLKSKEKSFSTFIDKIKEAITKFVADLKEHLKMAIQSAVGALASMILGPVVRTLQKAWTFLKQGYKSLKEAIAYIRNPENKNKPFNILMMEVGKIIIAGATAVGAIVLAETIETALTPYLGFEIPMLGSLASIIGLFLGAVISGIIGAIAINLIDRKIADEQRVIQTGEIISKQGEVLHVQSELLQCSETQVQTIKCNTALEIGSRHKQASELVKKQFDEIGSHRKEIDDTSYMNDITPSFNSSALNDMLADLDAK